MCIEFGLKPRDTVRTEHHKVPELVEFELMLCSIRKIIVNFWIKGSASKTKPEGYDGVVLVWDMLDAPPERPTDFAGHTMANRTPHIIKFDETESGKTVYIALCLQDERGIRGVCSKAQSTVVP
jgi:hypothetical protein